MLRGILRRGEFRLHRRQALRQRVHDQRYHHQISKTHRICISLSKIEAKLSFELACLVSFALNKSKRIDVVVDVQVRAVRHRMIEDIRRIHPNLHRL